MNRKDLKLYLVTDNNALKGRDFFYVVEEALKGGVTMVQLREKNLPTDEFSKKAIKLKTLTDKYNVPLIINDRLDIAFDCKAAGLHIGQKDIALRDGRRIMRRDYNKLLGVTANTVELAVEAEKMGADYLGVGAVFSTDTKDDATLLSIETLKEIVEKVNIPVIAIGGINAQNAILLKGMGLSGLAISSGIMGAEDVYFASKFLKGLAI